MTFRLAALPLPAAALAAAAAASPVLPENPAADPTPYQVSEIAAGLDHPWSLAFLPDGAMLVTERNGGLRLIRDGKLSQTPVGGLPEAFKQGQGGYLDIALDPAFAANGLVYISFAEGDENANHTAIARGRFDGAALHDVSVIFRNAPDKDTEAHCSGRLAFPAMGGEWQTQYDNRVPWGSLAMEQIVLVQAGYDGNSGHDWVASVLVSDLYVGDGFASTKVAAETVPKCVLGIYYSDTTVDQQEISSAKHDVDGHNGWLIETQLNFDIPGLETEGERVLLMVVQTGTDDYGLFYASIPDTRKDLLPDARQAMASLKVTS